MEKFIKILFGIVFSPIWLFCAIAEYGIPDHLVNKIYPKKKNDGMMDDYGRFLIKGFIMLTICTTVAFLYVSHA